MTLLDFFQLIKRNKKLCIVLPIAFALVCGGMMLVRGQGVSYTSNAYIVVATSAQLSTVNGAASSAARDYQQENSGYRVSTQSSAASLTVTVTVTGPDSQYVTDAADEVVNTAVEEAKRLLGRDKVSASIQAASPGVRASGANPIGFIIVAIVMGFLVAVCIVVGIDAVRRPVKSAIGLAKASDLPILGELPGDAGDWVLANVRFCFGKENLRSVVVVPVSESESALVTTELLNSASRKESPVESQAHGGPVSAMASESLRKGIAPAYEAREADAVVITASQWVDSLRDAEAAIAQLKMAGANVIGCVLVCETDKSVKAKGEEAK